MNHRSQQTNSGKTPRWRFVAAVLASALVAALVVVTLTPRGPTAQAAPGLPALPELAGLPVPLRDRLQQAHARALESSPQNAAVAELGRLFHANGFTAEAEACWKLLAAAQPNDPHWNYYLADLRRLASDNPGQAVLLENVTRLAPRYAPAWLHLADLRFKQGETAAAARAHRERLALLPRDPYARLGLARIDLHEGRRSEARGELEQIAADAPQFAPAQNLLAELLAAEGDDAGAKRARQRGRDAGRFREAEDPWLDELADWCFDYDRLCIRGTIENQTKHGDRGQALFERAIQLRPTALAAYELLGGVYLELNDGARARSVFERALADATETTPSAHVYVNLSRAHRLLRQPAEAVRVCREGLARLGDAPELYDALGSALLELGEREQAIAALRQAVAGPSVAASANYSLAVALIGGGQLDDAMAALHRALAAEPAYPPALSLLAQIEIDSGHWLDALKYLRPLYESHPELPEARTKMVDYYLHAGAAAEQAKNFAEAEQHYRAGCAIDANQVELQARLGVLCLLQRRFAAAVEPLEAYHRLAPEDPRAALFLGQAYVAVGRRDDARRILTRGAELAAKTGNTETAQHCRQILRILQ